jgi:hypothetical protein
LAYEQPRSRHPDLRHPREEPGRSFFRYRDPETDRVVTARDDRWNVRVFRVGGEKPFWHAVYSNTHRFSFGYMLVRRSPSEWLRRTLERVRGLRSLTLAAIRRSTEQATRR